MLSFVSESAIPRATRHESHLYPPLGRSLRTGLGVSSSLFLSTFDCRPSTFFVPPTYGPQPRSLRPSDVQTFRLSNVLHPPFTRFALRFFSITYKLPSFCHTFSTSFFSTDYELPIFQVLCFDIHTTAPGVYPLLSSIPQSSVPQCAGHHLCCTAVRLSAPVRFFNESLTPYD